MNVKVIPNFLPEPIFEQLLQIIFAPNFQWNFSSYVIASHLKKPEKNSKLFLLSHLVYELGIYTNLPPVDQHIMSLLLTNQHKHLSTYYDIIGKSMPEGQFLEIDHEKLIRIKINFYPNTTELHEHEYHIDHDFYHKGSILSLNTCDGYTKIREMGTKYPSVANTLLQFDSSKEHCSTTTTNAIGRFNININYQDEDKGKIYNWK